MEVATQERPAAHGGPDYIVFVDDREVILHANPVTGGEIMDAAGVPRDTGLIEIREDGTQEQVRADEQFTLRPGHNFKKAPRFKRG